ncbi:MAG TPA: hypothetical protein VNI20_02880, partial [Fimbriimonadaceae bacterium]|nr:hypothetical protein [Fimbriimonadaceae bacterium]
MATSASAQIQQDFPAVAVVDFQVNPLKVSNADLGKQAAAAIRRAIAQGGTLDVVPIETINRTLDEMGYQQAPTERAALIRLGQNLNVASIISGTVVDARIDDVGGGKQARILVRIEMRDVASGLVVNGAQALGKTGVRTGEVSEATLLANAIDDMAFNAVREMDGRQLPSATVLNTLNGQALINKGARSGFHIGMDVIIVRGSDQVGNATVSSVDNDSAFISFGNLIKGVQPGDKVRSLYTPATNVLGLTATGVQQSRATRGGSNSGLVSLLLVVLALAFLLGQGRGGNTSLAKVIAQSIATPSDQAAVRVNWVRDAFLRGNDEGPFQWQVWREDGSLAPVAVAAGTEGAVIDDALGTFAPTGSSPWY